MMPFTKLFRNFFHIPLLLIFLFSNTVLSAVEDTLNTSLNTLIKDSNEIKSPDQAFQLKATFNDLDEIELTWLIDKKCFLYKEKLKISVSPKQNFTSKTPNTTIRQDDEFFGDVEVYYNNLRYFLIADFNDNTKIDLVYQGCNETGFCYPPIKKQLILNKSKRTISVD